MAGTMDFRDFSDISRMDAVRPCAANLVLVLAWTVFQLTARSLSITAQPAVINLTYHFQAYQLVYRFVLFRMRETRGQLPQCALLLARWDNFSFKSEKCPIFNSLPLMVKTFLSQILEELCAKRGWDSPRYQLHRTLGCDGSGDVQLFLFKVNNSSRLLFRNGVIFNILCYSRCAVLLCSKKKLF